MDISDLRRMLLILASSLLSLSTTVAANGESQQLWQLIMGLNRYSNYW
jgi:hypothetical protein